MRGSKPTFGGVSFDLFGTLVAVDRPAHPAEAIAAELEDRAVAVPSDWNAAFTEFHVDVPDGRELSLPEHVAAALASRAESYDEEPCTEIEDAVLAAFDTGVRTRTGAVRAVDSLTNRAPVGVLSNCSVPDLAEHVLERSAIDETAFEAVVTSVGCGWRKPHPRAFETIADELGIDVGKLLHVGDDPETDGRANAAGATNLLISDVALTDLPAHLEGRWG